MSDGSISAIPQPLPQSQAAAPVLVKVDSLPPDIKPNTVISGQVIATDNNQVSIQTEQGVVVLQAALNVAVGQNINLKIQTLPQAPSQQAEPNFIAELLNVPSNQVDQGGNVSTRPATPILNQPVQQMPADPVVVHDAKAYQEYQPLQALILKMPDIMDKATLDVMVKSLLQLPVQSSLPPSLQEGFEKFDQLVNLLSQANLFPANAAQTGETKAGVQQNIISTLLQILQPSAIKNQADNPLLSQQPHQFIQLQTIQPGEKLSPNILVNIKDQLINILKQQLPQSGFPVSEEAQAMPSDKSSGILQSLIPKALTAFVEKATNALQSNIPTLPETSTSATGTTPAVTPAKPGTLFTLPAIGLVLGLPPHEVPQLDQANLVLMTTPLKQDASEQATPQHLIALLAPQLDEHAPLLPGSIIVAALKPQTEQMTSFAVLPKELLPQIIETFTALHPSLGENWPALDDLWQQITAQATTQPSLQTAIQQIIPSPSPQQLPPTMLFFLSVLKNDFTGQWIPEKHLAGLENIDKAALIKTLTQDLQTIKSRMEDNIPNDAWRPLPLPLQVGDQLMRLQWFYRHPQDSYEGSKTPEDEERVKKKRKTRFLLNVPKTAVGDVQIDGLVQEKNLDLILRTETMLASHMETAIRGRYAAVLETTGMVGGINFQSGRDHYIHV